MDVPTTMHQGGTAHERIAAVTDWLSSQLVGRSALIERLLVALLTGGHVLVEGAPGLAKTRAIKLFASAVGAEFARVQATPDLLPSDITGTTVYRAETGTFEFVPGPLFHNIILVDEVNRAPPKVQSALLEAMGERQVTVGGITRRLSDPFLVAATQNPIEHEGTYPLPEAQLDRFLFFVDIPMPGVDEERAILDLALGETVESRPSTSPVTLSAADLADARAAIAAVHLSPPVRDHIVRLVAATRGIGAGGKAVVDIEHPASPRGSIGLAVAARARAWLLSRDHVLPADVIALAPDVLSGRVGLSYRARAAGRTARGVVEAILAATPVI